MLENPIQDPTAQFLKTLILQRLRKFGDYARHPYGIAVFGSIGLHVVVAIALPFIPGAQQNQTDQKRAVVPVVELPADVQNRVPSTSSPLDLSVFENDPNFNLDLSGMNQGAMSMSPNGVPLMGNSYGLSMLPTPMAPSFGQTNYSFVPNSPPAIASRYTGFTPPPPPVLKGILPPPPSFAFSGNTSSSGNGGTANMSIVPPSPNGGQQQLFSITPQTNAATLQRQRQLEEEAAIALNPQNYAPGSPDIRFDANLLKPSELRNQPPANPPRSGNTLQAARNTSPVSQSLAGNYPRGACSSTASGTALYSVVVTPQGVPTQWSLSQSSGSNTLDNQASQDIRNARFDGSNVNYRVSVSYQYQPAFCAAFTPKPQPASTPAPAPKPAPAKPNNTVTPPPPVTPPTPPPTIAAPEAPPAPEPETLTIPLPEADSTPPTE